MVKSGRYGKQKYGLTRPVPKRVATKQGVKQMISFVHEKKFHKNGDATGLVMAIDTSAGFTGIQLTDVAQGVTDQTRVGDKLELLQLKFAGMVIGAHTTPVPYRIIIVQWYGEDAPIPAEIFSVTGATIDVTDVVGNQFNHDHARFYKILYQKVGVIGSTADTGPPAVFQHVQSKTIRKFGHKRVFFRVAGITGQNNIWLFGISNQTAASGDAPLLQYEATLEYRG